MRAAVAAQRDVRLSRLGAKVTVFMCQVLFGQVCGSNGGFMKKMKSIRKLLCKLTCARTIILPLLHYFFLSFFHR